jgi:WD40 repeat protein
MTAKKAIWFLIVAISFASSVFATNPVLVTPSQHPRDGFGEQSPVSTVDATFADKKLLVATCEAGREKDALMATHGELWVFGGDTMAACETKRLLGVPLGFIKEWRGQRGLWLVSSTIQSLCFQEVSNLVHDPAIVFTREAPLGISHDGAWHIEQSADKQDHELVDEKGTKRLKLGIKAPDAWFVFHPDLLVFAAIDSAARVVSCFRITKDGKLMSLGSIREEEMWGFVQAVCFSPDGSKLFVSFAGHDISMLALNSKQQQAINGSTRHGIAAMQFDEAGNLIVADIDGNIFPIDPVSLKVGPSQPIGMERVSCIVPLPGHQRRLILNRLGEGLIYDSTTESREGQISLLSHDGAWLAWVADGRFEGSEEGWQNAFWKFGDDASAMQPLECYFKDFYNPGLLIKSLTNNLEPASREMEDLHPTVATLSAAFDGKSSQDGRIATVRIKNEGTEAARDVRVFRNATLVSTIQTLQPAQEAQVSIKIRAGTNSITAYGFNQDDVRGNVAQVEVVGPDRLRRPGELYVLAIGINSYSGDSGLEPLSNAVHEARLIASLLNEGRNQIRKFTGDLKDSLDSQGKAGMGIESSSTARFERLFANSGPAHITELYNEKATKEQIVQEISRVAANAQPEDAMIIFFAGHGLLEDTNYVLCPADYIWAKNRKRDGRGEGISTADLNGALKGLEAEVSAIILTSCESGRVLDSGSDSRRGPLNARGFAQLAYEKGMYLFAAVKPNEGVQERMGTSLAAHALAEEALGEAAAGSGSFATEGIGLRQVLEYAVRRTPELDANGDSAPIGGLRMGGSGTPGAQPLLLRRKSPELSPLLLSLMPVRLDPITLEDPNEENPAKPAPPSPPPIFGSSIVPPVNRAGIIHKAVILPDGRVATADENGKLDLWQLPTLDHLASVEIQGPVSLASNPAGTRLACVTLQSDLFIVDATDLHVVHEFKGVLPSRYLLDGSVEWPSEDRIVGSGGGSVVLLNAEDGSLIKGFNHNGVRRAFLTGEPSRIVSISDFDGMVHVWNLTNAAADILHFATGHAEQIATDAETGRVAIFGTNGVVSVWDALSGRNVAKLQTGTNVGTVVFDRYERNIFVSIKGSFWSYDLASGSKTETFTSSAPYIGSGCVSDEFVIGAGLNHILAVWERGKKSPVASLIENTYFASLTFAADELFLGGRRGPWFVIEELGMTNRYFEQNEKLSGWARDETLLLGCTDHDATIWDPQMQKQIEHFDGAINAATASADGQHVTFLIKKATGGAELLHWQRETGKIVSVPFSGEPTDGTRLSPQGTYLLRYSGVTAHVIRMSDGSESEALPISPGGGLDFITAATFSNDELKVATSTQSETAIFAREDRKALRRLKIPNNDVLTAMTFSPADDWVACGDLSGGMSFCAVKHQTIIKLEPVLARVAAIGFNKTGSLFAALSEAGDVNLYSSPSGKKLCSVYRHFRPGTWIAVDDHNEFDAPKESWGLFRARTAAGTTVPLSDSREAHYHAGLVSELIRNSDATQP